MNPSGCEGTKFPEEKSHVFYRLHRRGSSAYSYASHAAFVRFVEGSLRNLAPNKSSGDFIYGGLFWFWFCWTRNYY